MNPNNKIHLSPGSIFHFISLHLEAVLLKAAAFNFNFIMLPENLFFVHVLCLPFSVIWVSREQNVSTCFPSVLKYKTLWTRLRQNY